MATAKIVLFKSKKLKDDKYPVMLCLRNGDNVKYFGLKQSATVNQWDEGNGLFKKDKRVNPDISRDVTDTETNRTRKEVIDSYSIRNEYLMSRLVKANEIIKGFEKNNIDWTFQMFEDAFMKKAANKLLFIEYLQNHIDELNNDGKYGNALAFNSLRVNLTALAKERKDLKVNKMVLQDVSSNFVKKYIVWLQNRDCKMNTINVYLRTIRALLNVAINNKIIGVETYPFTSTGDKSPGKIKISDYKETTRKRFLPIQYIRQMRKAQITNEPMDKARHLFLFCFFCYGISFADAARLRKSDIIETPTKDGNLIKIIAYHRTKTHKQYRIPISDDLQNEIKWFDENYYCIGDYLLPIVSMDKEAEALQEHIINKRKKFSKELKKIAQLLEFPEAFKDLSTYVSRHSFAMALRGKGAGIDIIGQALGHESTETTRIYLDSFDDETMAKMGEDLI